jgi:ketosteroid isomerase-like protein
MSQENVELLRRAYEAFNDGDPSIFLERYDPDILLCISPDLPETGPVLGAADVEKWFTDYFTPFGHSFRVKPHEFIDVGESVIVLGTEQAQGRRSGAEVEHDAAVVYTFRAGRIIRIDVPADADEARQILGLGE